LLGSKLRLSGKSPRASYLFDGRVEGDTIRGFAQVLGEAQKQTLPWKAQRQRTGKKKPRS